MQIVPKRTCSVCAATAASMVIASFSAWSFLSTSNDPAPAKSIASAPTVGLKSNSDALVQGWSPGAETLVASALIRATKPREAGSNG